MRAYSKCKFNTASVTDIKMYQIPFKYSHSEERNHYCVLDFNVHSYQLEQYNHHNLNAHLSSDNSKDFTSNCTSILTLQFDLTQEDLRLHICYFAILQYTSRIQLVLRNHFKSFARIISEATCF